MRSNRSNPAIKLTSVSALLVLIVIGLHGYHQKTLAEDLGKRIDRVIGSTAMRIDQAAETLYAEFKAGISTASEVLNATKITARVKLAILEDLGTEIVRIKVKTTNGVVILTGSADSQENKDRAEQIARAVDGVKLVDNRLSPRS